jgi:hypothetical protein
MNIILSFLIALSLAGCSGMMATIKGTPQYTPTPLPDPPSVPNPQLALYQAAVVAADAQFKADLAKVPGSPAMVLDAGVAAVDQSCQDLLTEVSIKSLEFRRGEKNVDIIMQAGQALAAALKASWQFLTAFGIEELARKSFGENFEATVLSLAEPAVQTKIWELMEAREATLAARMDTISYPQALREIKSLAGLCTPWAAKAAIASALAGSTATVTPRGVISASPK